jgi:hypothetical protein
MATVAAVPHFPIATSDGMIFQPENYFAEAVLCPFL